MTHRRLGATIAATTKGVTMNRIKRHDALMLAFSAYMADRRERPLARETRYGYRTRVARALAIASDGGHSILADDVRTLRYVLGKISPHPTSQTGYLSALQCFYDFLASQGLRRDNPAKLIGRPRHMKHAPRPLDLDACARYEEAAREIDVFHEGIAVFGLFQGWRRSEIRFAKWSWFFEADGQAWCDVTGKGARTARVPVHPRTVELLARLRAAHNNAMWLFPSPMRPSEPLGGTWFSSAHRRICAQAGIEEKVSLHSLRHSYATYLRAAGADLALVQMGLRHADPKSTQIYMRVFPEELARAQERLNYAPAAEGGSSRDLRLAPSSF